MKKNELMTFTHLELGEIRALSLNGEPFLIAKDVCDALDISNSRQALTRLEDDEKASVIINDGRQNRTVSAINESGFYELVWTSRKDDSKKFKRWIKKEVLPALRKDGLYIMDDATTEQKLYHPEMIYQTFKNCSIEHIEKHYINCIEHHKKQKTRLNFKRTSENRRSDKKKLISDSKIEIMEIIYKALMDRQVAYVENGQFEFSNVANNLLKIIKDDIWKVRHNKTRGKLSAAIKKIEQKDPEPVL